MNNGNSKSDQLVISVFGAVVVIWLGVLIAPSYEHGLTGLLNELPTALEHPFSLTLVNSTFKVVGMLLLAYALAIAVWLTDPKNYRNREEYGSAKWGNVFKISQKYRAPGKAKDTYFENRILTQNFHQSIYPWTLEQDHQRNLNTLVIGGSGSGKSFRYAKPNILQCNTSFIVLDPKGELALDCGGVLEKNGYDVKVFDLVEMSRSHRYNPFHYIHKENDVLTLVTIFFKITNPKAASGSQDPFWEQAAEALMMSLVFLLWEEANPEDQNMANVLDLLREAKVDRKEDNILERMINEIRERDQRLGKTEDAQCVRFYDLYNLGADKTKQSILITLAMKLTKFSLHDVANLTRVDELELEKMGERKTALFCIIPSNDTSFNFLVSFLYSQLFNELYDCAQVKHQTDNGGRLPVSVHFVMDEFANVALPDDFPVLLSTMRSTGIFVSIIIQNMAQLKKLFEKEWENIVGNCDEFLFLGGMEYETFKDISQRLGKETIDTRTSNRQHGSRGSYTTNDNITGRDLLSPDEVGRIGNKKSILFIRDELPIIDYKFDTLKHPNWKYTYSGGGEPFVHGAVRDRVGTFYASSQLSDDDSAISANIGQNDYEFISEEGVDSYE